MAKEDTKSYRVRYMSNGRVHQNGVRAETPLVAALLATHNLRVPWHEIVGPDDERMPRQSFAHLL